MAASTQFRVVVTVTAPGEINPGPKHDIRVTAANKEAARASVKTHLLEQGYAKGSKIAFRWFS